MNTISFTDGILREWCVADIPALACLANNAAIAANLRDGFPHPYRMQDAEKFVQNVASRQENHFFAIVTEDGPVGSIGLGVGGDVHRKSAEVGYWLGEPFWGRGIITNAVKSIVDYGFEILGLQRISAAPYANNIASRRVLEKAAFTLEGILRQNVLKNGVCLDQAMYARVRNSNSPALTAVPLSFGELRMLNISDMERLSGLYRYLHENDMPARNNETRLSAWDAMQNHTYIRCYGVWVEGQLVASCVLNIMPNLTRGGRPYGLIENVITHPVFRRRGIGTEMLKAVLGLAWQEDCYKVMLLTGRKTRDVFSFYESVGFNGDEKQGFIIKP